MLFYFLLPTQLRDQLPALREAIFTVVWALRRLDGQVHSYEDATRQGILPGSRTLKKREIRQMHNDLVLGLCLLEGALPVSFLNPGLHHIVHHAQYTSTHGLLRKLWMFFFERYVIIDNCCGVSK